MASAPTALTRYAPHPCIHRTAISTVIFRPADLFALCVYVEKRYRSLVHRHRTTRVTVNVTENVTYTIFVCCTLDTQSC